MADLSIPLSRFYSSVSAVRVFVSLLLRPLVNRWRSMGHKSFVYLDDGSQPDRTSDVAAAFPQRKDLTSSGLLVNEGKSCWVPMQVSEWLGFVINAFSMTFRIPKKKVWKL